MIELTYKNYFTVSGHGKKFNCNFEPLNEPFDNFFKESQKAAKIIWDNKQGPIHIMYSGGIDSEFMLSVFLSLKMKVTPVIIRLQPNYNDHDTGLAFKFCKDKGIKPTVVDIEFDKFVDSGMLVEYAKNYKCDKYHMSALMYAISTLDGTILCGGCEPYIRNDNNTWVFEFSEYEWSTSHLFQDKNIPGTPNFNCWTKEQNISFLLDPIMIDLAYNRVYGKLGSRSSKHIVYNRNNNFNLVNRPKLHGYELIEQSEIFKHPAFKEVKKHGKKYNGLYSKNYFDFLKILGFHDNVY